jgi:hypothetical protein
MSTPNQARFTTTCVPWTPIEPLIHIEEPRGQYIPARVTAQACRWNAVAGRPEYLEEKTFLKEADRRTILFLQSGEPLTAEDVPNEAWTDELAQYWLRGDGALTTNTPLVVWGRLDGEGGIAWVAVPAQ